MSQFSKTSIFYKVMRVYSNFIYKRWFNSIEVNGEGYIPEGEPVIFAPNHQNAFIDAMALLSSSPRPVVFWVRADLFNNKIIGAILRSLKMMPAYRMRNGFGNLKKNEESMCNSDDVLTHDQFLCLMPEGGQDEKRTLRPLVKGIFRSAFSAQEKIGEEKWVKIVPTGIDYGHYDRSGRHLVVNFGKPISIKDYKQLHDENAPVALNSIKDELAKRMKPLMLNITSEEHYDTFYTAAYLYCSNMLQIMKGADSETNRLASRQKLIQLLEQAEKDERCTELIKDLEKECSSWSQQHPDTAFSARIQENEGVDLNFFIDILYLIITLPLELYSIVINGVGYLISKILGKKAHGSGFESSIKFGTAAVLMPIIYIIETIIASFYLPELSVKVAFAFSLPLSFFFMLRYKWRFQNVRERIKNLIQKPKEPARVNTIMQQIISIIGVD